jgi:23S rRNA (pseudouridine1915-N3)-methyltransferase
MLKLRFIVVDRTKSAFLREGERFYLDRLKRYARTKWVEVKPARIYAKKPVQEILRKEGAAITKQLNRQDHVISLDRMGTRRTSEELASHIDRLSMTHSQLALVVGGPLGLPEEVLQMSHETLSLSSLTLTHEMARLILLEQLYRAFTIIRGEKYHK